MTRRAALALSITSILFPAVLLVVAMAALPSAVAGRPVLVLSSPFGPTADRIVALAGGWPVGVADPPVGRIAHSDDPDFLPALRLAGAWILLDAERLPELICGANV